MADLPGPLDWRNEIKNLDSWRNPLQFPQDDLLWWLNSGWVDAYFDSMGFKKLEMLQPNSVELFGVSGEIGHLIPHILEEVFAFAWNHTLPEYPLYFHKDQVRSWLRWRVGHSDVGIPNVIKHTRSLCSTLSTADLPSGAYSRILLEYNWLKGEWYQYARGRTAGNHLMGVIYPRLAMIGAHIIREHPELWHETKSWRKTLNVRQLRKEIR